MNGNSIGFGEEIKQLCQKMFIKMKTAEDKLTVIQDRLPKADNVFVTAVRFQPYLELKSLLQRKNALGQFRINSPSVMTATFLTDINVKSPGYTSTSNVSSAVMLSENRLVIADENNQSVKLIDTKNKRIISEYRTEKAPCDVTSVDKARVAVSLSYAKKVQILKSEDDLRPDQEMLFDDRCWFIACVDDKLVVSFSEPCKVIILSMAYQSLVLLVLHTFAPSNHGDILLNRATRLSVSSLNQSIYVSDWENKSVTMLDKHGNIMTVYADADLKWPRHTAVDDTGMVYICDRDSNTIHLLTTDCKKVKILLSERDGIQQPCGICYCKVTRRLYVSLDRDDLIKVFQLS